MRRNARELIGDLIQSFALCKTVDEVILFLEDLITKKELEMLQAYMPKMMGEEEIKAEIEVKNLRELKEALKARPDIIMLDNMKLSALKKAVRLRNLTNAIPKTSLEVSGGVNLDNVRTIAKTGVDMISIGCLTHSVKAIDISLEISREKAS